MSNDTKTIHPKLSKCNKCFKTFSTINIKLTPHPTIEQCTIVSCQRCHSLWYVCTHHNNRFSYSNRSKMIQHFNNLHPPSRIETLSLAQPKRQDREGQQEHVDFSLSAGHNSTMMFDNCDNSYDSSLHSSPNDDLINSNIIVQHNRDISHLEHQQMLVEKQFQNINSQFFVDEVQNHGHGICGITSKAFSQNHHCQSNSSLHEALFHLRTTYFCSHLTENQQKEFALILNDISSKKFETTKIPLSMTDIRKFYTSGKYSIYQNLPTPKTFQLDNHACISISDIIDCSLAIGIEIDLYRSSYYKQMAINNNDLHHIKRTYNILKEVHDKNLSQNCDPYVFLVIIWSDDFEVNHTRKNRNSTCLKTLTLVPPPNMSTSKKHTNAICLGRKNQDHSTVNTYFQNELKQLGTIKERYLYQLQRYAPTVVKILAMSSDRPERCALNDVLYYSGSSTRRWSYSSLVSPFKLRSCPRCISKRFESMFITNSKRKRKNSCGYCCDFDFGTKKSVNTFSIPENYPKTMHPNSPPPPKERDINKANKSSKLSPIKLSYNILTQGLEFAIFNYYKKVWSKKETTEYMKLLGIGTRVTRYAIDFANSMSTSHNNPESLFSTFIYPSMWKSNLNLDDFLETPMHHLFEGIVKTIIEVQMSFFKSHNKWHSYGTFGNTILADVNQLKLGYCRAEPFTAGKDFKTGGWIAETYLGYSRLMLILLNKSNKIDTESLLGYNELVLVVQTLLALLSRLMQHESDNIDEIDDYVKLFLAVCHYYENKIGFDDNSDPFWFKKSNFVSLLNLNDQIIEYGPVYLHWEGVRERFIQNIKPVLVNMRTTVSYLTKKLEKIHQDSTLEILYDSHIKQDIERQVRFDDFETFDGLSEVKRRIDNNDSMSGVVIQLGKTMYGIIVKTKTTYDFYQLMFEDDCGFHSINLWYSKIQVKTEYLFSFNSKEQLSNKVCDYIIIVPYDPNSSENSMEYTIISKNWKCRDVSNVLSTFSPSVNSLKDMIQNIYF